MLAIVAAVLFGLGLIFNVTGLALGVIGWEALMLAGLLCLALHWAGVAESWHGGRWRRRR